jgi:hypothetical protein
VPTCAVPTCAVPTCTVPTCAVPTCTVPTCAVPTCAVPTCAVPTCAVPTCAVPTCTVPTCAVPTCTVPTNVDGGIDKVCNVIPFYEKGTHNMGETFFLNIREGDTPENNEFSKHAVMLCDMVAPPKPSKKAAAESETK